MSAINSTPPINNIPVHLRNPRGMGRRSFKDVRSWEEILRPQVPKQLEESKIVCRKYNSRISKHKIALSAYKVRQLKSTETSKFNLTNSLRTKCSELSLAHPTEKEFLNALYKQLWKKYYTNNYQRFAEDVRNFINNPEMKLTNIGKKFK